MNRLSLGAAALAIAVAFAAPSLASPTCASGVADKALVDGFYNDVFIGRNVKDAPKYLTPGYIQHNPHVSPGLAGFMKDFGEGWSKPPPPDYRRVLMQTVADCDHHVVIYVEQFWTDDKGAHRHHLSFDMFHIEHGMIAEHWDADD